MRWSVLLVAVLVASPVHAQRTKVMPDTVCVAKGDYDLCMYPGEARVKPGTQVQFGVYLEHRATKVQPPITARWHSLNPAGVAIDPMTGLATYYNRSRDNGVYPEVEVLEPVAMFRVDGLAPVYVGAEPWNLNGYMFDAARDSVPDDGSVTAEYCMYWVGVLGMVGAKSGEWCPDHMLGNVYPLPLIAEVGR
jgi:hypothetical protein